MKSPDKSLDGLWQSRREFLCSLHFSGVAVNPIKAAPLALEYHPGWAHLGPHGARGPRHTPGRWQTRAARSGLTRVQRQCQRQLLGASAKEYIPAGLSHGWLSLTRSGRDLVSYGAERPHSGGDGETQGPTGWLWTSPSWDGKPWGWAPQPWGGLWALWSRTSLDEGWQTCSGPGEHADHVFQGMTR